MKFAPWITAELSGNHLGDRERAYALVEAAAKTDCTAVKFQTFTPEQMAASGVTLGDGPWKGQDALELYRKVHTPREWLPDLFDYARGLGLVAYSSVFHPDDVDFLEGLDCPIYKISGFELNDAPLLKRVAKTGKAMHISTGMATAMEIGEAVHVLRQANPEAIHGLTLLKCTNAYPAPPEEANLNAMVHLTNFASAFGLSDHSPGIGVAVAAVALGATVIEKHFTLSRADGGPDAAFSMEPDEFKQLVIECRRARAALGSAEFRPTAGEASNKALRRPAGGKRGEAWTS